MGKRKLFGFSILILIAAAVAVLYQWCIAPDVSCVSNEEKTQLTIVPKNVTIEQISLKYDEGFLLLEDQNDCTLDIAQTSGMEYIRVSYTDIWGKRSNMYFEISFTTSPGALTVTKYKVTLNGHPDHTDYYY